MNEKSTALDLVVVGAEVEVATLATPEQTIALLRKENAKLLHDLKAERSLFREMADCLIEQKLRPHNPLNHRSIENVLLAYKDQNPFWKSRAQEMEEANKPHQKVFDSDVGIKILADKGQPKLK